MAGFENQNFLLEEGLQSVDSAKLKLRAQRKIGVVPIPIKLLLNFY
tara:strand:- start:1655 stop:1792 length:138 start_codon:yes stop_codon:yes gene_type:complete